MEKEETSSQEANNGRVDITLKGLLEIVFLYLQRNGLNGLIPTLIPSIQWT